VQPVAWGELLLLVAGVIRQPVMWLLVAIGVLWGEWAHACGCSQLQCWLTATASPISNPYVQNLYSNAI
jgi:hypothetical protein